MEILVFAVTKTAANSYRIMITAYRLAQALAGRYREVESERITTDRIGFIKTVSKDM